MAKTDTLAEAIEDMEDLIRELNRVDSCKGFVRQAEKILGFLTAVRGAILDNKLLDRLLRTR